MQFYYVDSENVGDEWLDTLELMDTSQPFQFLVFYTPKSPHMAYPNLVKLLSIPKKPEFVLCREGNNALDFQLVTYLGHQVSLFPKAQHIIVSKDTGFDAVVHFWTQRNIQIKRYNCNHLCKLLTTQKSKATIADQTKAMPVSSLPASCVIRDRVDILALENISETENNSDAEIISEAKNITDAEIISKAQNITDAEIAITQDTTEQPDYVDSQTTYVQQSCQIAEPELIQGIPKYEIDEIITSCHIKDKYELSVLHLFLTHFYGATKGKAIYNQVTAKHYAPDLHSWDTHMKFSVICIYIGKYAPSKSPQVTNKLIELLYKNRQQPKNVANQLITHFGEQKGGEYKKMFKPFLKTLAKY